jgi:hypothetical protein
MKRIQCIAAALLAGVLVSPTLHAQQVEYVDEGGVRYQVITQTTQRLVPETRYETREYTAYRERYTTDMQESVRSYQVPVTEQQWVPGYQRTWNIFAPPVLSYRLLPVTRWETRTETVRIPVTRRDYIPEKQVQQVPIVTQRLAEEKHVHRVPVGPSSSGAPLMATRNGGVGGTQLENDPPREGSSMWRGGLEPSRP